MINPHNVQYIYMYSTYTCIWRFLFIYEKCVTDNGLFSKLRMACCKVHNYRQFITQASRSSLKTFVRATGNIFLSVTGIFPVPERMTHTHPAPGYHIPSWMHIFNEIDFFRKLDLSLCDLCRWQHIRRTCCKLWYKVLISIFLLLTSQVAVFQRPHLATGNTDKPVRTFLLL